MLDCRAGDPGSIPSIPSPRVGPLMAIGLKTSSDIPVLCRGRLGKLKTPSCLWHLVPGSRSKFGNWTTVPSLYSWNITECDVKPQPTNQCSSGTINWPGSLRHLASEFSWRLLRIKLSLLRFLLILLYVHQFITLNDNNIANTFTILLFVALLRKDKSLGIMSQKFLMLFLVSRVSNLANFYVYIHLHERSCWHYK